MWRAISRCVRLWNIVMGFEIRDKGPCCVDVNKINE